MKRILLYIVILAALLPLPLQRADVGKLRPIQAVSVIGSEEGVLLRTDTKDVGYGETLVQALENLRATTAGIVYLDTAEFLLLSRGSLNIVEQLRGILHNNVKLCVVQGEVMPWEATPYLSAHDALPKLKNWQQGDPLPILTVDEGRCILLSDGQNMESKEK